MKPLPRIEILDSIFLMIQRDHLVLCPCESLFVLVYGYTHSNFMVYPLQVLEGSNKLTPQTLLGPEIWLLGLSGLWTFLTHRKFFALSVLVFPTHPLKPLDNWTLNPLNKIGAAGVLGIAQLGPMNASLENTGGLKMGMRMVQIDSVLLTQT